MNLSIWDTQMSSSNRKLKTIHVGSMFPSFCHLSCVGTIFHTSSRTGSARKDFFPASNWEFSFLQRLLHLDWHWSREWQWPISWDSNSPIAGHKRDQKSFLTSRTQAPAYTCVGRCCILASIPEEMSARTSGTLLKSTWSSEVTWPRTAQSPIKKEYECGHRTTGGIPFPRVLITNLAEISQHHSTLSWFQPLYRMCRLAEILTFQPILVIFIVCNWESMRWLVNDKTFFTLKTH